MAIAARRTEKLAALKAEIEKAGGTASSVSIDVTNIASIRAGVAEAESALGPIDVLVNNSGVSVTKHATDTEEPDYDFVMDTNTKGAFFVAQAVASRMLAAKRPGRIINIASAAGLKVLGQLSVYCMSKAAVVHMTRALALEWGRYGINVNAVCPGYIETEINRDYWQTEGGRKLIACCRGGGSASPMTWMGSCCCSHPITRTSSTAL